MAWKILLADDSVTAQNMGRKILVDAGYDVLTVNNGSAALKRITESKPDLIVLDVYMPGYSGLEVCQRLKESPDTAHIPVLLTVGKLEPFKPQDARRVQANAHIVKPFEASELLTAIARLEDSIAARAQTSRFCTPVPGVTEPGEEDGPTRTETTAYADGPGRSGSRRPSTKKDGPEAEPDYGVANFRDFRKGRGKTAAGSSSAGSLAVTAAAEATPSASEKADVAASAAPVSTQSAGANQEHAQNAGAASDVPRDITLEELDALSAAAARLDATATRADSTLAATDAAPLATAAQVSAEGADADLVGANLGHVATAAPVVAQAGETDLASAAEKQAAETTQEVEAPPVAADFAVVAANEAMPPVEQAEPASQMAAAEQPGEVESPQAEFPRAESQQVEVQRVESQQVELQQPGEVPVPAAVNTALLAQEPAPIDQRDEPIFALAPPAEEMEAEAPAPSDDELAAALRLLTPATGHAEAATPSLATLSATDPVSPVSAQQTETSLEHPPAGEGAGDAASTRWMAEAVALTPEEAAMLLEAEMFRTFAEDAGVGNNGAVPAGEIESAPADTRGLEITAAVENSVADAQLTATQASTEIASPAEEAPKAMAAAAAAESSPAAFASEESDIAGIVDRVLADLRPKIVEEITKKLGKR